MRLDPAVDVMEQSFVVRATSKLYSDHSAAVKRCLSVTDISDVQRSCKRRMVPGENDDSVEVPAQPGGRLGYSLARIGTNADDPTCALAAGPYRVLIEGAKGATPEGPFLFQLSAPVLLDTLIMASALQVLSAKLEQTTPGQENVGSWGPLRP